MLRFAVSMLAVTFASSSAESDTLEKSYAFDVALNEVTTSEYSTGPITSLTREPFFPAEAFGSTDTSFRDSLDEFEALLQMPPAIVPYEDGFESVFFPDERTQVSDTSVYPSSATVLITTSNLGRCTGWVVARRTVITAGHCLHEGGSGGNWADDVTVYAGRDGSVSPFGSCAARLLFSVEGWVAVRDKNYDYGALTVDCDLGFMTGGLGLADPREEISQEQVVVSGYPVDKPLTQWSAIERVTLVHELKLFHRADTMQGMSGSAVHNGNFLVFGIHTNARHNGAPWRTNNAATRLTAQRLSNIAGWIDHSE